ncbi:proteasome inhibitor PI31 subunit-like [Anopheles nili]|uniref:proteasome inhibitor PI31 subunit-like n=1 Tax=Anopheles nili TaxID=185578 RepID=UPI00237B6C53|nr:proteasome inhibitor PI31 subunit-like [Anopheles nili]
MEEKKYFGLETLWKLERSNVATKSDLVMLLVHWFLTKHGFRNVGVGDDKTLDNSVEMSELLPEGWNGNSTSYALRYTMNNELYILHGTLSNETMILNLLHTKTLQVSNAAFNLNTTVQSIQGENVKKLIADVDTQITRLNDELLKPIHDGGAKSSGTQTTAVSAAPVVQRQNPNLANERAQIRNPVSYPVGVLLPRIGQADLDPLGRFGGGGMLMGPIRGIRPNGQMGVGQFLPGARFDPIGPNINPNNGPGPNPDHLPPPGYEDMFM